MPPQSLQPPLLPLLRHNPLFHPLHTPFHPLLVPHLLSRPSTHSAEKRANGGKNGPGKRLGAKKGDTELVVPGNIIFRQRGTLWFPGENCGMGRDHTIFALEKGYVKYYADPEKFPGRKYIGVVFERGDILPRHRNQARKRRLGLVSRPREGAPQDKVVPPRVTVLPKSKSGYMFRLSNWAIGRAAETARLPRLSRLPATPEERTKKEGEQEEAKPKRLPWAVGTKPRVKRKRVMKMRIVKARLRKTKMEAEREKKAEKAKKAQRRRKSVTVTGTGTAMGTAKETAE